MGPSRDKVELWNSVITRMKKTGFLKIASLHPAMMYTKEGLIVVQYKECN